MSQALARYRYRAFSTVQDLLGKVSGKLALLGPAAYNEDGLATIHAAPFLDDPLFQEAYALGHATGSWGELDVRWRCYVCCWAAWHAKQLEGDFVECGVNRGGYSRALSHYVDLPSTGKRLYLLDTFAGLVDRYITDGEKAIGRGNLEYEECYDAVVATFRDLPAQIIRGPVPDTLPQVDTEKVAYLSIDMNCTPPEVAAMEYFWPKVTPGGVMVHDDYGHPGHEEQRHAMDAFAAGQGLRMLQLPTGQGMLFKP
ncbi:MAG TPA: TylF/MycF/NovP-related O-methyltransferase [Acidimicrobiales bacterium]|jgi:O-methyltransferase|nr:TylF/MycF/NovP-related O-methyltransferase [Acidimicrobiales bacterium]